MELLQNFRSRHRVDVDGLTNLVPLDLALLDATG